MKNQLVNTKRISISNFTFEGGKHVTKVTFFSTITNKLWRANIDDFSLILRTLKNKKTPTQKDLNSLKKLCKNGKN